MSAVYYDLRGNVTEIRELTPFGTEMLTESTHTYTGQPLRTTVT